MIRIDWLPEGWSAIEGSGKWRCSWCLKIATSELYEGRKLIPSEGICDSPACEAKAKEAITGQQP